MKLFLLLAPVLAAQTVDPRNIKTGWVIPDEGYSDQPYIVKTADGAWLCAITTGPGHEGAGGQHVVTRRSTDRGKTWSEAVDVEPSTGPEASYAVLLKTEFGRVYVFYNHNTDNIRELKGDNPPYRDGKVRRVDSFGHFVYKYSDDHGRTWSAKRYDIPQRDFEIDRKNAYQGKIKFFWTVGRAFSYKGAGYVPLHKVGGFGEGFFTSSEGVTLRSANIHSERDPEKLHWETLPDGDAGLRTPAGGGPIAEEHSYSVLSDGSIFCVYRTIDGHSAFSYSRDGGRTWDAPQYMRFADGQLMKHPRAANFAWRLENGKYLYWFHNHGGRFIREHPRRRSMAYEDRNPVWVSGGVETDSPRGKVIAWSQPEILLYDDDSYIRMSYPDLIEEGGEYYVTETQKDIARVHLLDKSMLESLWNAGRPGDAQVNWTSPPAEIEAPKFPVFTMRSRRSDYGLDDLRAGFSIELRAAIAGAGQVLFDGRTPDGKGLALRVTERASVEITMNDGQTLAAWESDPGTARAGAKPHIVVTVDGGPKIISFVIDGKFNDGGDARQFGWGRFSPQFRSPNGAPRAKLSPGMDLLRVYNRALRTGEAVVLTK
ncbi:MAG: hypothetical protein FJW30_27040 [Acidobacteria bacterium]|nr:hypothetical protein [Acidobacteriota bacterium]